MHIAFEISTAVVAQHLIDELQRYDDTQAEGSIKDGRVVLEIECPDDARQAWELRAIVATFDNSSIEISAENAGGPRTG